MAFGLQLELPPQVQAEATAAIARREKEKEEHLHERNEPTTPEPKRSRVSSEDPSSLPLASPVKDSIRPKRVNQGRAASLLEQKPKDFVCVPVKRKVEEEKEDKKENKQKADAQEEEQESDSDDLSSTQDLVGDISICANSSFRSLDHPSSPFVYHHPSSSSFIPWFSSITLTNHE